MHETHETLNLTFEPSSTPAGDLILELWIDDTRKATARLGAAERDRFLALTGWSEDTLMDRLREALREALIEQGFHTEWHALRPSERDRWRFEGAFLSRRRRDVVAGLAWYDFTSGETGPEEVAPHVRNDLRSAVHVSLAEKDIKGDRSALHQR